MENILPLSQKDKQRFTRSKTIGEDYTEEKLRERITENQSIKAPPVKNESAMSSI